MQVPSIGRSVHYILADGPKRGEHRPATIVKVWAGNLVNLQVLTDSDGQVNDALPPVMWKTSVNTSPEALEELQPGTWHWPEAVT